jgi:2-amino-4-hydroxy-6-hydroxymethyldihydropteridine diphosphokinase
LWKHLRRDQFKGYKFRRQHPIGRYIVDFVCLQAGTVIELDGGHHRDRKEYDAQRTAWLKEMGYTVLRFWDNEVFSNVEGVKKAIWDSLPPLPDPPPQGGRGLGEEAPQGGRGKKGEPSQWGRGIQEGAAFQGSEIREARAVGGKGNAQESPQTSGKAREKVFIGLGSNLGNPGRNLRDAVSRIASLPGIRVVKISSVYRTEPVGGPPQPAYLNAAIEVETPLEPAALLRALRGIERDMGRRRGARNAPRIIDLDILLFGRRVVRSPRLAVPHPRMHARRFVLTPLAEIAGAAVDPGSGMTVAELLAGIEDPHRVERTDISLRRKIQGGR